MSNPFFSIPDLFKARRVLCVQPHPDDMDISIGGTIKQLTAKGVDVNYLTVTDDSAGFADAVPGLRERAEIRKDEQRAAGKILGVSGYHWLNLPDAGDWGHHEARDGIIRIIREVRPDILLTVDPNLAYEAHWDHIRTGRAAAEASLLYNFPHVASQLPDGYIPFELEAVGFVWTNNPNTVIDTSLWNDIKFEAVAKHLSQFPETGSLEQMKAYLTYRASKDAEKLCFELGEPLKLLPPVMLHCFPEAGEF